MNNKLLHFLTKGTLNRQPYFWLGCALMALKYNIDRIIAWGLYHRDWYFWNYVIPNDQGLLDSMPPDDRSFYLTLLLTSLPFLLVGLALTLCRLRSAKLPQALCLLFFVPIINLVFFVVLSLLPSKQNDASTGERWNFCLPDSIVGSALASAVASSLIVGLVGLALSYLSTTLLQNYGWGLFVALPFAMGMVSVLIYASAKRRSFASCLLVSLLPILFCGVGLFAVAAEGLICLMMAAPIGLVLSALGGLVGYIIMRNRTVNPAVMMLVLASVPFTMGMEKLADETPPLLSVTTSVVIDAPPEAVWPNVIAFSPIPPERDWLLHTGIAYPTEARIDGCGVGAVRHCIFSTGEFVEPIEIWDEPRLLRFSVADQPPSMEELSPYPNLETAHLRGFIKSHQGELKLTALKDGKTLLAGTTWYSDQIWPVAYWQMWSDLLIHSIHLRVLNHIKNLSEEPPVANAG